MLEFLKLFQIKLRMYLYIFKWYILNTKIFYPVKNSNVKYTRVSDEDNMVLLRIQMMNNGLTFFFLCYAMSKQTN